MNQRRTRRSFDSTVRGERVRPIRAARRTGRADRRPAVSVAADAAALAFLSDILIGERAWTLAEVQQLISLRESAERGRWRQAGLDDEGARAG